MKGLRKTKRERERERERERVRERERESERERERERERVRERERENNFWGGRGGGDLRPPASSCTYLRTYVHTLPSQLEP